MVFCAAIDLMLNILVEGIPGTGRLLLLKPRTILISESRRASRCHSMLTIAVFVTTDAVCSESLHSFKLLKTERRTS